MIETATECRNPPPGLLRRLAAMLYEALLVLAVLFVAAFVYLLFRNPQAPGGMAFFRLYLALVVAGYFLWFWTHGGQTLAMKTWHLRLVGAEGGSVTWRRACLRLVLAAAGLLAFGFGIWWALWDREGQFLHDRLAGTRLIRSR
jgi:uncharacterized RDD family membrane protein YckC